ncbi:MAG: flap endonuclease-1 [Candidatus Diapherotrites archaeon]
MGVALGELIEKEEISLAYLNGMKLGFDSMNIIYQFLSSIRGMDGTPLTDSKGNVTSHLTGLLYRTTNLVEKGIKPVFVFDGKHPELKSETLKKRTEIRTKAIEQHEIALREGRLKDAKALGSRALKLTPEMVNDAKKLLELMGFPVIQALGEGEAQIAFMCKEEQVRGCVSQDWDALLFGAPVLYRNITVSGKRKIPGKDIFIDVFPEKIDLQKALDSIGLNRQKLIWLAILIGTDFNEKFPKIGPKTALKLVQKFDSFEEIIKETKFLPEFDFKEVEDIFLKPKITEDYSLKFSTPKREEIISFLCNEHDFSLDRVENTLKRLELKLSEKGEQSSLNKWF